MGKIAVRFLTSLGFIMIIETKLSSLTEVWTWRLHFCTIPHERRHARSISFSFCFATSFLVAFALVSFGSDRRRLKCIGAGAYVPHAESPVRVLVSGFATYITDARDRWLVRLCERPLESTTTFFCSIVVQLESRRWSIYSLIRHAVGLLIQQPPMIMLQSLR